jgi:uncharacterized membrane protein
MTSHPSGPDPLPVRHEPRWPIALVLGGFIALSIGLRLVEPERESLGPHWLIPSIEVALLVLLFLADPSRIASRRRRLRRAAIVLVGLLAGAVFAATAKLIVQLIQGGEVTNSASPLLASGALIWLGNVLVFSLLYWLLDSGGPYARYVGEREFPDLAFTQHQNPELAPPDWRPQYADYLVLGLTTNTAFSPTDVLPLSVWAKLMMSLQSLIALAVLGLVIARAVNVFT